MSTPTPKPGERWRFTYEGEIADVSRGGVDRVVFLNAGGYAPVIWDATVSGTWERLPDPEPEWQAGDVVDDASGNRYCRMPDGWAGHPSANFGETYEWMRLDRSAGWGVKDAMLNRPLTRLVPEVKP